MGVLQEAQLLTSTRLLPHLLRASNSVPSPFRRCGGDRHGARTPSRLLGGGVIRGLSGVVEGGSCSKPRDRLGIQTICFPGTGVGEHHQIVLPTHLFAFAGGASYMVVRIPQLRVWSCRETG